MNGCRVKVGPLRIGTFGVLIRTSDRRFAGDCRRLFADLAPGAGAGAGAGAVSGWVVFDVDRRRDDILEWSVLRDGVPCETHVQDDAVLTYVQWELCRLFIESNPAAIHAASVSHAGRAVILAGESHSGKTTLAGWLACRYGFGLLSDEVAAVDESGMVLPFPRPLGVRAESPLAGLPGADVRVGERLVPVSALGGSLAGGPVPPGLLVFPRFESGAGLVCRRVGESEALERLAVLTPGLRAHGRLVFDRLTGLVSAAAALEVVFGDVDDVARWLVSEFDGMPG